MTIAELFNHLEAVTGIEGPTRKLAPALLYLLAAASEVVARTTGKPALLSWATVRVMMQERDRSRFDHGKSHAELGVTFRPVEETLADEIAWFQANGLLSPYEAKTRQPAPPTTKLHSLA